MADGPKIQGQGFTHQVKGRILVLEIDLDAPAVRSTTGKSMVVASTRGNITIDGTEGLILGFTAYRKA